MTTSQPCLGVSINCSMRTVTACTPFAFHIGNRFLVFHQTCVISNPSHCLLSRSNEGVEAGSPRRRWARGTADKGTWWACYLCYLLAAAPGGVSSCLSGYVHFSWLCAIIFRLTTPVMTFPYFFSRFTLSFSAPVVSIFFIFFSGAHWILQGCSLSRG